MQERHINIPKSNTGGKRHFLLELCARATSVTNIGMTMHDISCVCVLVDLFASTWFRAMGARGASFGWRLVVAASNDCRGEPAQAELGNRPLAVVGRSDLSGLVASLCVCVCVCIVYMCVIIFLSTIWIFCNTHGIYVYI